MLDDLSCWRYVLHKMPILQQLIQSNSQITLDYDYTPKPGLNRGGRVIDMVTAVESVLFRALRSSQKPELHILPSIALTILLRRSSSSLVVLTPQNLSKTRTHERLANLIPKGKSAIGSSDPAHPKTPPTFDKIIRSADLDLVLSKNLRHNFAKFNVTRRR